MPAKKAAKKTATKRAATKPNRTMSAEHKEALARGRNEGRAVRAYLAALDQAAKPGRRMSKDELEKRLAATRDEIAAETDPVKRLELIQKRLDLEERLSDQGNDVDLAQLEADFVAAAAGYAERKGISYSAFRESGVPAATLKAAGIRRTRKS
ncbi:hypothetical protein [Nitriliruptor alkaliphilus]|uniref:hypothetical protein n=1 Tax=Nitriliruptor alkaliphilus TaxID=427918 RepID=UPI0006974A25|nr:hypothetical protein [Nitriliruptor alkaliphilus]